MTLHPLIARVLRLATLLASFAVLPCVPGEAQNSPETPEDVAQQFTAALRDTNWLRMAALMHPRAIAQFRGLFSPVFQCEGPDGASVRQSLFGTASAADVARMSDTVLLAAIFRLASTREEGLTSFLRTAQIRVLGHVAEGADTVHVLTRLSFAVENIPVSTIDVASFERFGPTWRVLLKADFSALAAMLRNVCGAGG